MPLTKTFYKRGPNTPGRNRSLDSYYHSHLAPGELTFGRGNAIWGACWGNIFYVHASGSGGTTGGTTPEEAVTSLDAANNLCVAANNDLVIALPGHTETLANGTTFVPDTNDVTFIGLGRGTSRPAISMNNTASQVIVSGSNCCFCNFLFTGDVDAIVAGLSVTGSDFAFLNSEWRDVTGNALDIARFSATADRPLIDGFFMTGSQTIGSGAGITNSVLVMIGCDNPVVRNSTIITRADISLIECRTTAVVQLEVYNCRLSNLDNRAAGTAGTCVEDVITGSTGLLGPDLMCVLGANAANITEALTGATFWVVDPVYVVNAVNEKAMLINWTASTDA